MDSFMKRDKYVRHLSSPLISKPYIKIKLSAFNMSKTTNLPKNVSIQGFFYKLKNLSDVQISNTIAGETITWDEIITLEVSNKHNIIIFELYAKSGLIDYHIGSQLLPLDYIYDECKINEEYVINTYFMQNDCENTINQVFSNKYNFKLKNYLVKPENLEANSLYSKIYVIG